MGFTFNNSNEITDEILYDYVKGKTAVWLNPEIENHIKSSVPLQRKLKDLLELAEYDTDAPKLSEEVEKRILGLISNK